MNSFIVRSTAALIPVLAAFGFHSSVFATDGTWVGTVSPGNWADPSNWSSSPNVPGTTSSTTSTDTATLAWTAADNNSRTVNLDAFRNLFSLSFNSGHSSTLNGGLIYLSAGGRIYRDINSVGGASNAVSTVNSNIELGGNATIENLSARGLRFGANGTSSITGSAATGFTSTLTLTGVGSSRLNVVNSAIGDGSNGGSLAVVKSGTGVWTLSGANTYTGATSVQEGILWVGNRNSLYGGNTANWTAANISVSSGASLGVIVGGANNFVGSDLQALLSLGSATGGFQTGSLFRIETSGGDFTYNYSIANPNGGTNALTIVKEGANTLTLTQASSYTGGTSINGGVLLVEHGSALGTGSATVSGTGTLQLANNISLDNTVVVNVSRLYTGLSHIVSASGNNTISNGIQVGSGVTNANNAGLIVESQAGNLTISGTLINTGAAGGARPYLFKGSGQTSVTGDISNGTKDASVIVDGPGIVEFFGSNSYRAGTTVNAGTLLINNTQGSGTGTGTVTVNTTATLGGDGAISGVTTLAAGSFLSPGSAAGVAGSLSFGGAVNIQGLASGTGGLIFQLDSVAGSDLISLTSGVLSIGVGILDLDDFNFSLLGRFGEGTYTLFDSTQTIVGSLGSKSIGTIGGYNVELAFANSNQDIILNVSAVPEPGSLALLVLGLGTVIFWRRRGVQA